MIDEELAKIFDDWLATYVDQGPFHCDTSSRLFASWQPWAIDKWGGSVTHKRFAQLLKARGFEARRRTDGITYLGLCLKEPDSLKRRDLWLWLEPGDHARLRALAADDARTPAQLARVLILQGMRGMEQGNPR
jgi:hypothetical protein